MRFFPALEAQPPKPMPGEVWDTGLPYGKNFPAMDRRCSFADSRMSRPTDSEISEAARDRPMWCRQPTAATTAGSSRASTAWIATTSLPLANHHTSDLTVAPPAPHLADRITTQQMADSHSGLQALYLLSSRAENDLGDCHYTYDQEGAHGTHALWWDLQSSTDISSCPRPRFAHLFRLSRSPRG